MLLRNSRTRRWDDRVTGRQIDERVAMADGCEEVVRDACDG